MPSQNYVVIYFSFLFHVSKVSALKNNKNQKSNCSPLHMERDVLMKQLLALLVPGDVGAVPETESPTSADRLSHLTPKLMNMIYVIRRRRDDRERRGPSSSSSPAVEDFEVLLGHKSRGFGAGNWNAFGGKVERGVDVSIAAAAARELHEECGLLLPRGAADLRYAGVIIYRYPQQVDISKELLEVHLFVVFADDTPGLDLGQIRPSEEMNPVQWYPLHQLPLQKMWRDDFFWLSSFLEGVTTAPGYQMTAFFQFFECDKIAFYAVADSTTEEGDAICQGAKSLLTHF